MASTGGKNTGLGKAADAAGNYAGDLMEPIALLVSGASKASVAWAAFRNVWMTKVLGPVGMLTGAAAGAATAMVKLGKEMSRAGMEGASSMEKLTASFKPLLKGIESAKQRMAELAQFAAKTPFTLDQVAEASRTLEVLTRGALATEKGLKLVGDAASVTGRDFGEMATWIGRLYDGLQSGRPIGEVAQQLQAVGVLSGSARSQIESLIESGKAGNEVWAVAEREIGRVNGAMEDQSKTLDGLLSNLKDNQGAFQRAFSNGYIDGEKAGVEALSNAYERLTPLAENLGKEFGRVSNLWEKFKGSLMGNVAVPALEKTGSLLAKIGAGGVMTILGASIGKVAQSLTGALTGSSGGSKNWANAFRMMGDAALSGAKSVGAFVMGDKVAAKSMLDTAKNAAESAVALGRAGGASGVLGGAMKALGGVLKFVGGQFKAMIVSIIAQPIVIFTAAVVGLYMAWSTYREKQEAARKAVADFNQATREQNALLSEQLANVKNLNDLNGHYASVTDKLAKARRDLLAAEREAANAPYDQNAKDKVAGAQERVRLMEQQAKAARSVQTRSLERRPDQDQVADQLARRKALEETAFQSALQVASPEQRARLLAERSARTNAQAAQANADEAARTNTMRSSAAIGADRGGAAARVQAIQEAIAAQRGSMPEQFMGPVMSSSMPGAVAAPQINPAYRTATANLEALQAALEAAQAEAAALNKEQGRMGARTEQEGLRDLIQLIDDYAQAQRDLTKAVQDNDSAAQASASARAGSMGLTLQGRGVSDLTNLSGLRQSTEQRLQFMAGQDKEARDQQGGRSAEASAAAIDVILRNQNAVLDAAEAEVKARADSYEKTMALLGIEENRLNVALAQGQLTKEEAEARRKSIAADREVATRQQANALIDAAISKEETLTKAKDDSLERELEMLNLARQRMAQQTDPALRKAGMEQIDAEEKVVRQTYARRDAMAKLDQKDAANAGRYRGAERERAGFATERERIGLNNSLTAEEKKAALDQLGAREGEFSREQGRTVKRSMLETSIQRSSTREEQLRGQGNEGASLRERKRRQKDERELQKMAVEEQSEQIADAKERQKYVKDSMAAFDEAQKTDMEASRNRKQKAQEAWDAYAAFIEREKQRIQTAMQVAAQNERTTADMAGWLADQADALNRMGIKVDEASQFDRKQREEESAAQKEDAIKLQNLMDQYLDQGYDVGTADKMARSQVEADQRQRATDARQERAEFLMGQLAEMTSTQGRLASAVSSAQSIGSGSGGAYGPQSTPATVSEIKNLVAQIKELLQQDGSPLDEPVVEVPRR